MKKILFALFCLCATFSYGQKDFATKQHGFVHKASKNYVYPTDPQVLAKLNHWKNLKLGLIMHWGIYSVPGITESWELCSEGRWFSQRRIERFPNLSYDEYKKWYWNLANEFNPVNFDPYQWAEIMKFAGFKYVYFTTKHHDGFCMYDTQFTDYKITNGPYKNGKYSNIAYYIFDAFRKQDFMIGAYFSKPDWHHPAFWDPHYSTPTRHPNYDVKKYPEKWAKFQQYTANQIDELMTDYGRIDLLRLDGGWVRKPDSDIKMDEIIDNARVKQPGLISVDRTVFGRNENIVTPELTIPKEQSNAPWESSITLSNTWGWNPNPKFKSGEWIINTLSEIVAKGGSLLLDVGPTPDGRIEEEVVKRLTILGNWLKKNGEAIYSTVTTPHYNDKNVWFTANKDGKTIYAIYALPEGEKLPEYIEWTTNLPKGRMVLMNNNKRVKYSIANNKVRVYIPQGCKQESLAFKFVKK